VLRFFPGSRRGRVLSRDHRLPLHWFRYEDRAKAVALFMSGDPGEQHTPDSPISGLILSSTGSASPAGAGVFICEGIPAVIFGFITRFYLT